MLIIGLVTCLVLHYADGAKCVQTHAVETVGTRHDTVGSRKCGTELYYLSQGLGLTFRGQVYIINVFVMGVCHETCTGQ